MSDEEKIEKWIKENKDSDNFCYYCIFQNGCSQDMACYGGMPVEPYCVGREPEEYLDIDAILEDIEENANRSDENEQRDLI